jgi:glycosyltransferase involved in cell wall biosynthesis
MAQIIDGRSGSPQVLIISQIFLPETISTGQILTELGETLTDLGAVVEVWCGPPTLVDRKSHVPRRLEHHRMVIRRVRGTRFSKIRILGKLLNQLSFLAGIGSNWLKDTNRRPALVTTDPPFLFILCALLFSFRSRPIVYLVLDVYPDTAIHLGLLPRYHPLTRLWNGLHRLALRRAAAIVVLGRRTAEIIEKKGRKRDSLASKTHVIHLWSDELRIRPRERPPAPRTDNNFILMYAGNMGRVHDMETIMRAAGELAAEPHIHFEFIGEGFKKRWMEEFARERGMANCRFGPYVAREELGDLISSADAGLVSLIQGQEGLSEPCKTFGIMAAGRPVLGVLPRASEMAGIVIEHRCGVVVDPGDVLGLVQAIKELADDPGRCAEYGRRGRKAIESRFGLRAAAARYHSLLNSLQPGFRRSA